MADAKTVFSLTPQVTLAMMALGAASTAMDWARQAAGTIADRDLMLAANSAMALGVADTADEVSRFQPLIA